MLYMNGLHHSPSCFLYSSMARACCSSCRDTRASATFRSMRIATEPGDNWRNTRLLLWSQLSLRRSSPCLLSFHVLCSETEVDRPDLVVNSWYATRNSSIRRCGIIIGVATTDGDDDFDSVLSSWSLDDNVCRDDIFAECSICDQIK